MHDTPRYDLCVIGGAGHVGLPLSVAFANQGVRTVVVDINEEHLKKIEAGTFPFTEERGDEALREALGKKTLSVSRTPSVIAESGMVLIVVGTPIDEYLNPDFRGLLNVIESCLPFFRDGQILILRSTVYPGTTDLIQRFLTTHGKNVHVAFCPERIVQGKALKELENLPQMISACDERVLKQVEDLFKKVSKKKIIPLSPMEAELAKLFSNAWRYLRFAVANQFFMIAQNHNLDYNRIHRAMCDEYPRNEGLPTSGFAAGPCLLKDTMQLAAFARNQFFLGHAAMLINEGMPDYVLRLVKQSTPEGLSQKTVGILGMAFKPNCDDKRDSLSYKLKKLAKLECKRVYCHDPHIADPSFHSLEEVIGQSDIILLATPHDEYRDIDPKQYPNKRFVDIWNILAA